MLRVGYLAIILLAGYAIADILLKDEGVTKGPIIILDCRGPTCTRDGGTGTIKYP